MSDVTEVRSLMWDLKAGWVGSIMMPRFHTGGGAGNMTTGEEGEGCQAGCDGGDNKRVQSRSAPPPNPSTQVCCFVSAV